MKPIINRLLIFLVLFLISSGILGSWIVPTKLLYGYGFYIYGNLGKMVFLSAIMFILMTRGHLGSFRAPKWAIFNLIYIIIGILLVPTFFFLANMILHLKLSVFSFQLSVILHIILIAIPLFFLIGVFGWSFIQDFIKKFKKEIFICAILSLIFDFLIYQVWKLWPIFSNGVLAVVSRLLSFSFQTIVIPPRTLIVNNFAVSIEQACSGLDSLFMFSALYVLVGFVDWKKLDHRKYLLMYLPVACGLYLVNIFRVYLIVLIGVVWSPEISLRLFHTYAGMILFIVYFLLFMKLMYQKLLNNSSK